MMNKKGGTMSGLIITLLLVMALFYGLYGYVSNEYEVSGVTPDIGYNESYAALQESQESLDANVNDLTNAAKNISEADATFAQVAWNGLVGLASTIRLFVNIIDVASSVWEAIFPSLGFLPRWLPGLMLIAIIITTILIIIGAFKGENKT